MRLKNIGKEKEGISLIVLLIVIGVILILLSTITISLDNIVTNSKKRQFAKEIYEIQSMVDTYKKQNDDYPYVKLAEGNKSIDLEVTDDNENQVISEDIVDDKVELYVINLQKIGANEISRGYNQNDDDTDVYAFSNKTGMVYYVKGYSVRRNTYYTLTDELKKLIGINNSNSSSSGIIKGEIDLDKVPYEKNGLVLYLDGINNTRKGHNSTSIVWEDLSGNRYDYILSNVEILNNSCKFYGNTDSFAYNNLNVEEIFGNNLNDIRTIELVVKPYRLTGNFILSGGNSSQKAFGFSGAVKNTFFVTTNKYLSFLTTAYDMVSNYCIIYDINNVSAKRNNIEIVKGATGYWDISSDVSYIGKRENGRTSYNGEVMAIRVYNRVLTEEEIKNNYDIDKERFNIE